MGGRGAPGADERAFSRRHTAASSKVRAARAARTREVPSSAWEGSGGPPGSPGFARRGSTPASSNRWSRRPKAAVTLAAKSATERPTEEVGGVPGGAPAGGPNRVASRRARNSLAKLAAAWEGKWEIGGIVVEGGLRATTTPCPRALSLSLSLSSSPARTRTPAPRRRRPGRGGRRRSGSRSRRT